jgi:BMFP domain-containing protein YqiC
MEDFDMMIQVALNCDDYVLREQMQREINKLQEENAKKWAEKIPEKVEGAVFAPVAGMEGYQKILMVTVSDEIVKKLEARINELETALAEAKGISVDTIKSNIF